MPKYFIEISARNFLVDLDGTPAKHGFVTIRYVEAGDPKTAILQAMDSIRQDVELRQLTQNSSDDPPTMEVTEMGELDSFEGIECQPGWIWYPMKPARWWQFWRR